MKEFASKLFFCLEFLHQQGIFHGNICTDKIMIVSDDYDEIDFKLIDFGTADFNCMDVVYDRNLHTTKAFTPPEIAKE